MSHSSISRFILINLLVFIAIFLDGRSYHGTCSVGAVENESLVAELDMEPKVEGGKMVMMMMNERRRKLGSFHICSLCTCCGGGTCLPTPCCYAINCNIPNKPFGFCAFTPRTCNCFGCHI